MNDCAPAIRAHEPYANLREEFADMVDMGTWRTDPRFHAVAAAMYGSNDICPRLTCVSADEPPGSTYGQVSEALHKYLHRPGRL
jgi:hypothetical protein